MSRVITVSYSELNTAQDCLKKHEWAYKERWSADETSAALRRGTAWHLIMAEHFGAIMADQQAKKRAGLLWIPTQELIETIADRVEAVIRAAHEEDRDLLEWMYEGHLTSFGLDSQWQIRAVEHEAVCWLPTERGTRSRFKLKMVIDLVVFDRSSRQLFLVDHKSGKDLPTRRALDLDDQFGLYTWGMRQLGRRVLGSIHSAARTQMNKDRDAQTLESRFSRTMLTRTDGELDSIALDAYRRARYAWSIPVGAAPRSTDTDRCKWKCSYLEICLLDRKGVPASTLWGRMGFRQEARDRAGTDAMGRLDSGSD